MHKILNSPRQQRVGDEWAGTMVVRLSALPPGARRSGARFLVAAAVALVACTALGFAGAAAQISHHAGLSAQDAVEIVAVSKRRAREHSRGRELRVAVQVRYALRSAPSGALQLFVLREGEVIPQPGRHHVARGSGSVALKAEVHLPARGAGSSRSRRPPARRRALPGAQPGRAQRRPRARPRDRRVRSAERDGRAGRAVHRLKDPRPGGGTVAQWPYRGIPSKEIVRGRDALAVSSS